MAGIKRVYCKKLNRIPYKSISKISPLCNKIPPYIKILLSPRKMRRVAAASFRESGGRSAVSRERALLHYQACCADSWVALLLYSANERYYILQHYSADSRDVILSRRACGVSKNLLRSPRSNCNAIIPAYLYTHPIVTPQDPSTSRLAFRSALRSG